jgi:hypothetical protein
MNGLSFHRVTAISESAPERVDIACFVGVISARAGRPLTPEIAEWLSAHSWADAAAVASRFLSAFPNVPIPIENWSVFDALYQWESRTKDGLGGPTWMGKAVRSFFSQGGQKCYVVSIADSLVLDLVDEAQQRSLRERYLPPGISEQDRNTWKGAGVLFGLEDVSLVVLPDLPELVRQLNLPPDPTLPPPSPVEEHFVRCDDVPTPPLLPDTSLAAKSAPRCDQAGYTKWTKFLTDFRQPFLGTRAVREAQLIVAMPIPADAAVFGSAHDLISVLPEDADVAMGGGFASGFIQVCYPWLKTDDSLDLPEQLLPPDGLMAGLLARNALARGTYSNATKIVPNQLFEVDPELARENYNVPEAPVTLAAGAVAPELILAQRVSLFGPTPAGFRLRSDVTTSKDATYRSAPTRRLISAVVRTARTVGEGLMFGASGPRLWGQVRTTLQAALKRYWQAGALDGETASSAFTVRCDGSTITQNDKDSGRVIAEVTLNTAVSLEQIRILMALTANDVTMQFSPPDATQEVA